MTMMNKATRIMVVEVPMYVYPSCEEQAEQKREIRARHAEARAKMGWFRRLLDNVYSNDLDRKLWAVGARPYHNPEHARLMNGAYTPPEGWSVKSIVSMQHREGLLVHLESLPTPSDYRGSALEA